jgi:hypothetical protein
MLRWALKVTNNGDALRDISELKGGTAVKPMSVLPLIMLLIVVLYAIYALRPH